MLQVQFVITDSFQKKRFIETSDNNWLITKQVALEDLTEEVRSKLFDLKATERLYLADADKEIISSELKGENLYTAERMKFDTEDPIEVINQYLDNLAAQDDRKAIQEAQFVERDLFNEHTDTRGWKNEDAKSVVDSFQKELFDKLVEDSETKLSELEAMSDLELPIETLSIASHRNNDRYDFNTLEGGKMRWEYLNSRITKAIATKAKAKKAATEKECEDLKAWAMENGNELLKARIKNDFNWKYLAVEQKAISIFKDFPFYGDDEKVLNSNDEYDTLEEIELQNPTLKQIETFEKAKGLIIEGMTVELRRVTELNYQQEENSVDDLILVTYQVSSTRANLYFSFK